MKKNLNLFYKIVLVFFIISHFHPLNFEGEWIASISYLILLILLGIDITKSTIRNIKELNKKSTKDS